MADAILDRIEKKLDDQNDHLSSIDITLVKQQMSLDEHIKRTDALEEQVTPLTDLRKEIKGVMKLIYLISALAAIVECIRLFK